MTFNQSYFIFLIIISLLNLLLIHNNYHLQSLLLFSGITQIFWLFFRLIMERNISILMFLTYSTFILLGFRLLKIFISYFLQENKDNVSFISIFIDVLYKRPFIYIHTKLLELQIYHKIIYFGVKFFIKVKLLELRIIFVFFFIIPFTVTTFFLFYAVFYKTHFIFFFFFLSLNYLLYNIMKSILFVLMDYYQKIIEDLIYSIKGTKIESIEKLFQQYYTPQNLGVLWHNYIRLMFCYGQFNFLYFHDKKLNYYKEFTLEIYFFNICFLFLEAVCKNKFIFVIPFEIILINAFVLSMFTIYFDEKKQEKSYPNIYLRDEITKLKNNYT